MPHKRDLSLRPSAAELRRMKRALGRALKRAGGQSALGRIVGTRQSTIQYWLQRGFVSDYGVLPIERATGVSRHELRPDLYPAEAAGGEAA